MDENINFLSILRNGCPIDLSISEIFDKKAYDDIKIVTYVTSPSFLSKTCKGFNSIEIILGIDDEKVRSDFATNVCKYLRTEEVKEFYNKLDKDLKVKLVSDEFSVYFSHNYRVHDKIYLLENSKTKDTRIIIGSANLSQSAFSNTKQFETIEIYDNDAIRYEYYIKRFNEIRNNCVDYFPKTLKESVNTISTEDIEIVPVISSEKDYDILMDQVEKLGKVVVLDDVFENIDDSKKQFTYILEEVKRDDEVLKLLTKKNPKGGNNFKSRKEIDKIKVRVKTIISKKKIPNEIDQRVFYKYDNNIQGMFIEQPGNDLENNNERILSVYPKKIDSEGLKNELELVVRIVESYTSFATEFSKDNRSKIFDIILYSFYSAFIWKARDQYVAATGTETERRYIYPFLIIGGDYESGKSTILDICGRLIGNNEPFYLGYDKISKVIRPLMETENICPLLVDEIPQSFFTSKNKNLGESLIKSVANDLSGQHPCFIGTTNVRDFHVSGQILTRILYYEVDTNFDKTKSDESKQHLHNIRNKVSDELYRDFCYRVIKKINGNEDIFSRPDILNVARDIFIEYFNEVDLDIPSWVYYKELNDYKERGVEVWQSWYQNNKDKFKVTGDTIYINALELWGVKDKNVDKYIDLLDKESFKDYSAPMLLLNKNPFFHYIKVKKKNKLLDLFNLKAK